MAEINNDKYNIVLGIYMYSQVSITQNSKRIKINSVYVFFVLYISQMQLKNTSGGNEANSRYQGFWAV